MRTRIFTLLVAFLAIAGNAVWAAEPEKPEGLTGEGTEISPYELDSKEDLEWFRDLVNDGDYDACAKLTADIDLESEEWEPIYYCSEEGITAELSYTGTFDGNNKTIKGLNISDDPKDYATGLFGAIGVVKMNFSGSMETEHIGEVKNLTVEGSFNEDLTTAGGICGYNAGTIQNCVSSITTLDVNRATMGGICAYNLGTITKCINKGNIRTSSDVGGICGKNRGKGIVEQCYNEGSIQGTGTANVGGICGSAEYGNPVIRNCYNVGELASENSVSGICCVPSPYGSYETHATITNCHNYGTITPTEGAHQAGICTVSQQSNVTVSISNNYYLENEAITETVKGTEPKSAEAFAKGKVLYLLQQNSVGVWVQTIGTDDYPKFETEGTPSTVYQVTVQPNDATMGTAAGSGYYVAETEITVTATANEGYKFVNWTSGDEEQSTEASYTFTVTSDVTLTANFQKAEPPTDPDEGDEGDDIHHPQRPIKYYNIYVDTICPGLDVETSKDVVQEGHQVSAYLTIQAECDTTGMRFEYKRGLFGYWQDLKELEGVQPGEYIIPNIYTDIYIRALDVTLPEEEPTGIEDVESIKAYAKEGSIYVYTPSREEVTIISMSGAIIKHAEQVGLQSYSVNRGIYIVRIGEKVFKLKN